MAKAKTRIAKKENNTEKIKIYFEWFEAKSEGIQYKPNGLTFVPRGVRIAIDVPHTEKYIESYTSPDDVVLTMAGVMFCTNLIRNAISAHYRTN